MPSNPDSQIVFRNAELAQYYDANFGRHRRHQSVKIDIERYQFLLQESIPKLSKPHAIALWMAFNGANTSHPEMLPILQQSILNELGDIELIHQVKSWSLIEWVAVIDACDRVGGGKYHVEDLAQELERAGLINGSQSLC